MKSTRTAAVLCMAVIVCTLATTQAITRRSSESRQYRRSSGSLLSVVKFDDAGPRKRTVSTTAMPFNHTICIVFDSSYANEKMRKELNRTLRFISDRLCVEFIDVTNTIDRSDSNWGIKHGCQSNAYILVTNETTCNSPIGAMNGKSAVHASVCNTFYIMAHEMMHALTALHVQEDSKASSYISVFRDNIQPYYLYTYQSRENTFGEDVDCTSTLMYTPRSWSNNGDRTYGCMREDKCSSFWISNEKIVFKDLNQIYKCNEYACGNAKVNCGKGYYAKVNGACQCVCPNNLDPATKCASMINGPNSKAKWPTQGVVLAGGADNKCPSGTGPTGWLSITGSALGADPSPVPFPTNGKDTTYVAYCAVNSPAGSDMYDWSFGGDFCIGKEKGVPCGGVFNEFQIQYTSYAPVTTNGSCGDITVSGRDTTLRLCCKEEFREWVIQLPNDKPFRLWTGPECPIIEGMRSYDYRSSFKIAGATWSGGPYSFDFFNMTWGFYMQMCYYIPPVYGCSQTVSLGIGQRSVTFETPGFPNARLPNRRCLYRVTSDIAAFLLLIINKYDLAEEDYYLLNRNSDWESSFRLDNSNPLSDLVSERASMSFEYWSSNQEVNNTGVSFTVKAVLPSELCYNYSTRGADYLGSVNISEYYRPCLDWSDTYDCYESPYDPYDGVQEFYESNYCRNPGGKLLQPWCFVAKNGSNCEKQYCDVCHLQRVVDVLSTSVCSQLISNNPSFCSAAVQRFGCAKSCSLLPVTSGDCPPLYIPYGDRCFYFSCDAKTKSQALQFCTSQGVGGTLFQVRCPEDNIFLLQYANDKSCSKNVMLDAKLDVGDKEWVYMRTDIPLAYSNFTAGIAKSFPTNTCGALVTQDDQKAGSWGTYTCTDSSVQRAFACQSQRVATCPSPSVPADGVLTDAAKTFYHEGDRVTIQCKYSLDPVPKQIMCKGGSWTDLKSACSACPVGWDLYGDVCIYYHNVNLTIVDAENFCRSQSPERNSTLFRVKTEADYRFVCEYQCRIVPRTCCCDHMFVDGRYINKRFVFTDSPDQDSVFVNMTDSQMKSCKNNSFVYIYRAYSSSGRGRSEVCLTDLSWSAMPVCQMNALGSSSSDKYGSCQKAVSQNARFCTYPLAPGICPASCGLVSSPKNCSQPTSSTYSSFSVKASIPPGDFMNFTCKPGFFLVGGDTQRACGLNGQLLGQEPQCINNPKTWDVGRAPITTRLDTLPSKTCFLLDREEYRVPFPGKISAWYCMTVTAGNITFVVFRKSGSSYTLVGSNTAKCVPNVLWGVYIDAASQITVKQGDLVGAHLVEDNTLQVTTCDYNIDSSFKLPVARVDTPSDLSSAQFSSPKCIRPNMGYQITR